MHDKIMIIFVEFNLINNLMMNLIQNCVLNSIDSLHLFKDIE